MGEITENLNPYKRWSIEIIEEILSLEAMRKTGIMYKVNMSYTQCKSYLNFLLDKGFLEEVKGDKNSRIYRVTPKGHELRQKIQSLLSFLNT